MQKKTPEIGAQKESGWACTIVAICQRPRHKSSRCNLKERNERQDVVILPFHEQSVNFASEPLGI